MASSFDIAVVGMACRFPDANNPEEFWNNLISGKESIKKFTRDELFASGYSEAEIDSSDFVAAKASLDDYKYFDNHLFGYLKDEVDKMDPQCRLLHECCWHALEDAAYIERENHGDRIGLFAGAASNIPWISALMRQRLSPSETFDIVNWNLPESLITRTAYRLGLNGPAMAIHTACSTSLVAIHTACQSILSGDCELALAGGVSLTLPQESGYLYQQGMVRSADGHCRPFDIHSNGTVGGSGAGILLLKTLEQALEDNDHVHAIIKGSAINNDGQRKPGFTAPSVQGQAEVIASAQMLAGVESEDISYVECHGTATEIGDPIEVTALNKVFAGSSHTCMLGAVKSNIGHLDEAAGVAGVIKVIMALKHKRLPPTLHYTQPNEKLHLEETVFQIVDKAMDWDVGKNRERIAGVSSFGIGGTNAHIILAEADEISQPLTDDSELPNVFLLSAETQSSLNDNRQNLFDMLKSTQDIRLSDIAYVLQEGRVHHGYRKAFVASNKNELIASLASPIKLAKRASTTESHIVFLFPGQGAQYRKMASSLYEIHVEFRSVVDKCLVMASQQLGESLKEKWFDVTEDDDALQKTVYAQPAIFIVEYALSQCLITLGIQPSSLLGYSFGELVSATVAGVFSLQDAIHLVVTRGKLMQDLPSGAMLSVPLPTEEVSMLCPECIAIAIDNKDSCVVSGTEEEIERFAILLKKKRIMTAPLKSSHAAHSPMMKQINAELQAVISRFSLQAPTFPIISSVTGSPLTESQAVSVDYWASQVERTVHFARGIEYLLEKHKKCLFIEVGVGRDLINLARRYVDPSQDHHLIQVLSEESRTLDAPHSFWVALGKIWQQGINIQWDKVRFCHDCRRIPLPGYAFDRELFWPEKANFLNVFSAESEDINSVQHVMRKAQMSEWLYQHAWKQQPLHITNVRKERETAFLLKFNTEVDSRSHLYSHLWNDYSSLTISEGNGLSQSSWQSERNITENREDILTQFSWHYKQRQIAFDHLIIDCVDAQLDIDDQLEMILSLLKAYRLQNEGCRKKQITFLVSYGVNIGNEVAICPNAASIIAIANVIRQEFSEFLCQVIDLGNTETDCDSEKLIAEITSGGNETAVWRNHRRWSQDFIPYIPFNTDSNDRLKKQGTYLLIGGSGFIGQAFSEHLAKLYQANLIITSRSEGAKQTDNWKRTEQYAQSLTWSQVNATDREAMSILIEKTIQKHGRIDGIFYLAGITGEDSIRSIVETDQGYIKQHFEAKKKGILILEELLVDQDYDFCVVVSSLAPILGGLGFYAYAAASAYLDAYVLQHNYVSDHKWILVNWDGWEVAEKTELNNKVGSSLAHLLITREEGVGLLQDVLSYREKDALIISTADINTRLAQWSHPLEEFDVQTHLTSDKYAERPELDSDFVPARNEAEEKLVDVWERFLNIRCLGIEDDFFDLGGNSLKAITLLSLIHKQCDVDIPLTWFFKHPTVKEISEYANSQIQVTDYQGVKPIEVCQDTWPLSPGQRRLYIQQMLNKESVAYNETAAFRIVGKLDVAKFRDTLNQLMERHESLRTTIELVSGEPRQQCYSDPVTELQYLEYRGGTLCDARLQEEVKKLIKPFHLGQEPLIRLLLIELDEDDYLFFLDLHHIISDGLSQDIFVRDFLSIYQGHKLTPLNIQYKDYTMWQIEMAESCKIVAQRQFWLDKLSDLPELQLPLDFSREELIDDRGRRVYFCINDDNISRLLNVSGSKSATNFMVFLSTYYLLLADRTRQTHFAVGTPVLGRPQSELQDVIGMFVNLLPVSCSFHQKMTFRNIVDDISETMIAAFDNTDIQFEEIVKALNLKPSKNRMPIFDTVFSYMNIGMADFEMPGLKLGRFPLEEGNSRFDLAFLVKEIEDGYEFSFEYKQGLFKDETIELFMKRYIELVDFVADYPDVPIEEYIDFTSDYISSNQNENLCDFNF